MKALLEYRATPIPGIGLSPSQLSMGRRPRTTLPIARGLLEPEAYNRQEIRARMKHSKERQKYYYDLQSTKELPPLRPGNHVRVKPEPGSKVWRAATVVEEHTSPKSYVVDIGGRRIRRNRVALRTDSSKSHMGFQKCYTDTILQPEPDPENARPVPSLQTGTHNEHPTQVHYPDPSAAQESPTQGEPLSSGVAEAKNSFPYTSRSGRQIKKPVKLDL